MDDIQQRMPFRTSQEIDPCLLARTVQYRAETIGFEVDEAGVPQLEHGLDNPLIVPQERALNNLPAAALCAGARRRDHGAAGLPLVQSP